MERCKQRDEDGGKEGEKENHTESDGAEKGEDVEIGWVLDGERACFPFPIRKSQH